MRTRALDNIDRKLEGLEEGSLRYQILSCAKIFKTSWIELGRSLYAVWKDKHYKEWGFVTFEAYVAKEIGIRKETAFKLLKSYYFLEREEPSLLKNEDMEGKPPAGLPSYEAVNILRLAKEKSNLGEEDYARIRASVIDSGKDARDVKKDLAGLMRQRDELRPEEAREKKRVVTIRRYIGTLKTLKRDLETEKLVSGALIREISSLITKIEKELE